MKRNLSKRLLDGFIDLIYPRRCVFCGRTIKNFQRLCVCPKCSEIEIVPKYLSSSAFMFEEAAMALKYDSFVRNALLKFKFNSVKYYGYTFAKLIFDIIGEKYFPKDSIVCCVPVSCSRDRSYNQIEIVTNELCDMLNIKPVLDLLYKSRDIPPLSKMKKHERKWNIIGAIGVNPQYDIYGKNIIVIDDVFTSGATSNECAKVLKTFGAKTVRIVCICHD